MSATKGTNDQLFVDVLAQIEREPKNWNQADWARKSECGTAHCFAGHAVALSGYEFVWEPMRLGPDTHRAFRVEDEELRDISVVASELFGITRDQAVMMFSAENTLRDLYRWSARYTGIDEQVLRDKVRGQVSS